MKVGTAWAVRADQALHFDKRYGPCDTTSMRVYGEDLSPEPPPQQAESQAQPGPLTIPSGSNQAKRSALKPCVCSTLCVDRAVPHWGQPEDGKASDKTGNHPLLSNSAAFRAQPGGAPDASISVADAARVTEEQLAALGDTLCSTRFLAPYHACGWLSTAALAHNPWEAIGVLAHPKPTKQRSVTS